MKLSIQREKLLQPITQVVGVVERRQTLPVLANFLISARDGKLSVTGTDMEVELITTVDADVDTGGETTVPARKLVDIVRMLPDGVKITFAPDGDKLIVASGKGRYTLATLPATEFPATDQVETLEVINIQEVSLKNLLDKTAFAMANQDVRYYLNGLLFDFHDNQLTAVATDGHRLALCDLGSDVGMAEERQLIVPRKGVLELSRMLSDSDDAVELAIGKNHIRLVKGSSVFTSKLIDGRFPEYRAVIPKGTDKHIKIDREAFTRALQRASILSNEKYKGVRLEAEGGRIKIIAHNPQHEEAIEELEADLNFDNMAIGFNVTYLLDALLAIDTETVLMELKDANSSCLISAESGGRDRHVVMPLKL
ncbi:MAG: DNA polymerase III subunit beta [Xanthomonadales bacterium]|nr:DNA polymerase III subunit beta [Gammaproteobacteria bacterium]MBT8050930.1 DNA polymerase III subunit beta [Gammaproteobacteria bacterium]MBT8057296.1 DNA polymerase III subunit beta [Gammaproteobacteria bacterium]NNJ78660.1 DNA polymerase III subunit beta [Xanthomonadales bacterium]NNL05674.1 DNA polymerase III subunit beta [Xanthomonadales bacterium]